MPAKPRKKTVGGGGGGKPPHDHDSYSKTSTVDFSHESGDEDILCMDCDDPIHEDKSLNCDMCQKDVCISCSEVSGKMVAALGKARRTGVMWVCKHCRISLPVFQKISIRMNKSDEKQEQLEARLEALEKKCADLEARPVGGGVTAASVGDIVNEVLLEQREREGKKTNIIIAGLVEIHSEDKTDEDRRNDDKENIEEIISNVMMLPGVVISTPVRLGRYDRESRKPRLVRVSVESVEVKKKIIDKSRVCKKTPVEVYVKTYSSRATLHTNKGRRPSSRGKKEGG